MLSYRELADAIQRCHALGKPVGIVGGTADVVAAYRAMGFDFLAIASDLGLLMGAAKAASAALRAQAVSGATVGAGAQQPAQPPPMPAGSSTGY